MALLDNLDHVLARRDELSALMATGELAADDFAKMSQEYSAIEPVCTLIEEYHTLRAERGDLEELLADPEMADMAAEDVARIEERMPELEEELKRALLPKDEADARNAILEVRAGTGGDEAALFAGDLYEMYKRFASEKGWKFEAMEMTATDLGGLKEATARISGIEVFAHMKFESGVHRVQRIPKTESGGRIHTSAATVAVLPEAEEVDIEINPSDLKIDTFKAQGAGGQHVNTTDSAVRITHIPTGTVVACQEERSQHKNRAKAMSILRSRIYEDQRLAEAQARDSERKSQVGSGDRSQRIRTYNFPQGRVTDHRIGLTLQALDQILAGPGLDQVVEALRLEEQAEKLADLEGQS
ncbi:MAG: peptide chain release factor 1 [Alphaproteobacteria bacterium]